MIFYIALALVFLVYPSVQIIRARKNDDLRVKIEKRLHGYILDDGQSLFDNDADYAWLVQWFRWAAIPTAFFVVVPTPFLYDLVGGIIVAVFLWIAAKFFSWGDSNGSKSSKQA